MKRPSIESIFFLLLVMAITITFVIVIKGFLLTIFWSIVIAILINPIYNRLLIFFRGNKNIASLSGVAMVVLMVLLPLGAIGYGITKEAVNIYERISSGNLQIVQPILQLKDYFPAIKNWLNRFGYDLDRLQQIISNGLLTVSKYITSQAFQIGQNTFQITVLIVLMLYFLFFILRDGDQMLRAIINALPLSTSHGSKFFLKFAQVTRATMKGTIIVALVQGTLGGLVFWMLGIQASLFWGVIMSVLSLLPALGAAVVWLPAAIILMAMGHIVKGIILILAGVLVIGLVDNLLRPILVGHDTRIPDYLILLSTIGGLTLFGLTGFILGPVIAGLFISIWEIFALEYRGKKEP